MNKNTNKNWTEEEDLTIKTNIGLLSYKQMSNLLPGRPPWAIKVHAKQKLNITNQEFVGKVHRKYDYNRNFWKNPNLINSYWAGFMCADGCIGKYGTRSRFTCGLSVKDEQHLRLFVKTINYTGKFRYYKRKSPSSNNITESIHVFIDGIKEWLVDLEENFNIVQNKTLRIGPPNLLKDELLFAFLCGYIDGDGCISPVNDGRISIVNVSSSEKMLLWIQDFIDKKFDYQYAARKQTLLPTSSSMNKKCQRLAFTGYKAAIIFDYMRQIPVPKLSRKWENPAILEALEKYKNKRPDLFGNYEFLPKVEDYLKYL